MSLTFNEKLYGTKERPVSLKHVRAGPLDLKLEGGNVRYIRFNGIEVLRAVSFLVRDSKWGTYSAKLKKLEILEKTNTFIITYNAACHGPEGQFEYQVKIQGSSAGQLEFSATGSSPEDFPTNRVGFVVLHPLEGVVGKTMTIEHTDGHITKLKMPKLIAADQPAFDIRALSHRPRPGLSVRVEMLGDAFEMEDQRNWSDASFKTYVRPLAKPRPYIVEANKKIVQSVTVNISGVAKPTGGAMSQTRLAIEKTSRKTPVMAFGLDAENAEDMANNAEILKATGVRHIIARLDTSVHNQKHLESIVVCRNALNVNVNLEVIIPGFAPKVELLKLADSLKSVQLIPASITVSPQRDLKTRTSRSSVSTEATLFDIIKSARKTFPQSAIGAGTFAFFTEFNRNPPPVDDVDFVTHATCGIVHAADDHSVIETLETFNDTAHSVQKLAKGKPYIISPSAIGMRHNPYGETTAINPRHERLTLARIDPRQSGIFAAAWTIGYFAAAQGKVDMIALSHGVGDFGIIEKNGRLKPIFHAVRGTALGAGKRVVQIKCPTKSVLAFGYEEGRSIIIWFANMTPQLQSVKLPRKAAIAVLNAETFVKASRSAVYMDHETLASATLDLSAYAIARVVL